MKIIQIDKYFSHIPAIAEWLYNEWGCKTPGGSVENAEKTLMEKPGKTGIPLTFAAILNNELIGVARLIKNDMDIHKDLSPWLASAFILEEYRNMGIGKELCSKVIYEAGKLGFPFVYLFTPDMVSFYKKQGWETIEQTAYRNENVFIMRFDTGEEQK